MNSRDIQNLQEAYAEVYLTEASAWLDTDAEWSKKPKELKSDYEKRIEDFRKKAKKAYEESVKNKGRSPAKIAQQTTTARKLQQNPTFFNDNPTNRLTGKLSKTQREEVEIEESNEPDPFGRPGGKYGGVKKGGGYDKGYKAMQRQIKKADKGEETATAKRYKEMREERDPSHPYYETNRQFKKSQKKNKELTELDRERQEDRQRNKNPRFVGKDGKIRKTQREEYGDIILSHLLDEGYANSEEAAEVILQNMSENWMNSILEAFVDPVED